MLGLEKKETVERAKELMKEGKISQRMVAAIVTGIGFIGAGTIIAQGEKGVRKYSFYRRPDTLAVTDTRHHEYGSRVRQGAPQFIYGRLQCPGTGDND